VANSTIKPKQLPIYRIFVHREPVVKRRWINYNTWESNFTKLWTLTQYIKQFRYIFCTIGIEGLSKRSYFTRNTSYVNNVTDWEHPELRFTFVHNILWFHIEYFFSETSINDQCSAGSKGGGIAVAHCGGEFTEGRIPDRETTHRAAEFARRLMKSRSNGDADIGWSSITRPCHLPCTHKSPNPP